MIMEVCIGNTTTYMNTVLLIWSPTGTYTGLHTGYMNRVTEKDDTYSYWSLMQGSFSLGTYEVVPCMTKMRYHRVGMYIYMVLMVVPSVQ